MRFLLEFMTSCTSCRSACDSSPADDTKFLVRTLAPSSSLENRHYRSRKRCWTTSSSKSGSSAEWRPSLNAISEDNVVAVERQRRDPPTASERLLKQKVSPSPRSRDRNRRSDEYARAPVQAIMPAFSPTPFLF